MDQPLGCVDNRNPHLVCQLRKALYGLNQSLLMPGLIGLVLLLLRMALSVLVMITPSSFAILLWVLLY